MSFYLSGNAFLITPSGHFASSCPGTPPPSNCCSFYGADPQYSRVISIPFRNQGIGSPNALENATWTGFLRLAQTTTQLSGAQAYESFNIQDLSVFDGEINSASFAFDTTPPFPNAPTIPGTCAYGLSFRTFAKTITGQAKNFFGSPFSRNYDVELEVKIRSMYRETLVYFRVHATNFIAGGESFISRPNFLFDLQGNATPVCNPSPSAFYAQIPLSQWPSPIGSNFRSTPRSWVTSGGYELTDGIVNSWSMNMGYTLFDAQGFQYLLEDCPAVMQQVLSVYCPQNAQASASFNPSEPTPKSGDCGCGCNGDC